LPERAPFPELQFLCKKPKKISKNILNSRKVPPKAAELAHKEHCNKSFFKVMLMCFLIFSIKIYYLLILQKLK
jgi:hypothetical protein